MPTVAGSARRVFVLLLLALALAGTAYGTQRTALAATTISNCADLAAVKTTLEAGGDIVINCGVVTLNLGSEIVIDSDTTIDGLGKTTLSGGDLHRVMRIDGSLAGVTATLRGLTIIDGLAAGAYPADRGGGVYAIGEFGMPVTLHLEEMTFSGNTADSGGAVYNDGSGVFGDATLTATHTTFSGNTANEGGAVYSNGFDGHATVSATHTTFIDNTADSGGAVYNDGSGVFGHAIVTATHPTFSGNTADSGGAVYSDGRGDGLNGGSATVTVTNATFSGNSADFGGAVYSNGGLGGDATLEVTHTTFSGNTADVVGGAVYTNGVDGSATTTLTATILSDSTGDNCNGNSATVVSNDFNLADDATCILTQPNDLDTTDDPAIDPLLGLLANNGGPSQTHALLSGSPAIDTADCFEPTDQRGVSRPQDGDADGTNVCDRGAVERKPTLLLGTSLNFWPQVKKVLAGATVYVYFAYDYFAYDGNAQTDILASALVGVANCKTHAPVVGNQSAVGQLAWQRNYERYVYYWKTERNWPAGCRQLILTFVDGSELRLTLEVVRLGR